MTTTDAIYLIKETSICNYVMIIHSPHLCGLPGFRADHSDVEMAKIRCREVISDDDFDRWIKGEAVDMPFLTIGKEGHYGNLVEQEEQKEQKAGEKLGQKQVDQNWETVQLDDGTTVDGLKEIIDQMFSSTGEGEDEVMLITLDDEGEQPVVLQADLVGARREIRPMDPDTMALLVRDYLRNKDKPKKDEDEQEVKKLKDEL
jgi:protein OS-9